jgi:hypothetical protein
VSSPTARSLKYLREAGYAADIVERWIPGANIRKDLYGCIDIVAVRPGETLGVQTTSYSNMSARYNKALQQAGLRAWLEAGNQFVIHGWHKRGNRWQVKTRPIEISDMP